MPGGTRALAHAPVANSPALLLACRVAVATEDTVGQLCTIMEKGVSKSSSVGLAAVSSLAAAAIKANELEDECIPTWAAYSQYAYSLEQLFKGDPSSLSYAYQVGGPPGAAPLA